MPDPRKTATSRRRVSGLLFGLLAFGLLARPAEALQSAQSASGTQAIAAGRYQAVLALVSAQTFRPVPLVLDLPAASTDSVFIKAVNTGTLPLTGGYYAMTVVPNASGVLGTADLELQACTGTWNDSVSRALCSTGEAGIAALDVTGNVLSAYAPLPVTPAGRSLQVKVVRSDPGRTTRVRLDLGLRRAQARPARMLAS